MVNVHVPLLLRVVYIHQVYSRTNAPEPKIPVYLTLSKKELKLAMQGSAVVTNYCEMELECLYCDR